MPPFPFPRQGMKKAPRSIKNGTLIYAVFTAVDVKMM